MLYNINDYFDKLQISGIDIPIGMRLEAFKAIDIMGSFCFEKDTSAEVWKNLMDDIFSAIAIREKDELIAKMIFIKHFRVGDYSNFISKNENKIIYSMRKNSKKEESISHETIDNSRVVLNFGNIKTEASDKIEDSYHQIEEDKKDNDDQNTQLKQNANDNYSIFDEIDEMIEDEEFDFGKNDDDAIADDDEIEAFNNGEVEDLDDIEKFANSISGFKEALEKLSESGYDIDTKESADEISNEIYNIAASIRVEFYGKKNKKRREELFDCLNIVKRHKIDEEKIEREIIGETIKEINKKELKQELNNGNNNDPGIQYISISRIPESKLIIEIERIANEIVTDRSRDIFVAESGTEIDLFDTVTESLSNLRGVISNIYFYKKDKGKARILAICDLSGSMRRYINISLNLMLNMRKVLDDVQITAFSSNDTILTENVFKNQDISCKNWKKVFQSIFNIVSIRGTSLVTHLENVKNWAESGRLNIDEETIVLLISDMLATDVNMYYEEQYYCKEQYYYKEIASKIVPIKNMCKEIIILSPNEYNQNFNNLENYRKKLGIRYATIDTINQLRTAISSIV